MATAKKTPAKKATNPATKAKVAAPAKKPAKAPAKASDGPLYTMPQEVKDWIERAQSIMNHQKGEIERLKEENEKLKAYRKFAEHRILRSDHE